MKLRVAYDVEDFIFYICVCYLERIQLRSPFLLIPKFFEHFPHMLGALTWHPRDETVREQGSESEIAFNLPSSSNSIRQKLYKDVAEVLHLFVSVTTSLTTIYGQNNFIEKPW